MRGDGLVDDRPHARGVPAGLQVLEVERGVELIRAQVAREPLLGLDPGLAAEHPRAWVGVGDRPPAPVDLVHAVLIPVGGAVLGEEGFVLVARLRDVGQPLGLDHPVGDVDAKAVDPEVEPEAQDRLELGDDLRVLPVEVGLGAVEEVEVPEAGVGAVGRWQRGPAGAVEHAAPVVRRLGAPGLAGADDVALGGR